MRHCFDVGSCLEIADDEVEHGIRSDPVWDPLLAFPMWGAPDAEVAFGMRRRVKCPKRS